MARAEARESIGKILEKNYDHRSAGANAMWDDIVKDKDDRQLEDQPVKARTMLGMIDRADRSLSMMIGVGIYNDPDADAHDVLNNIRLLMRAGEIDAAAQELLKSGESEDAD